MLRICTLFLLLVLAFGKAFADVGAELDVVFKDSTLQCRYLYVLSLNSRGTNDTLAVFDTLSFNGQNRVSLFYTGPDSEYRLSMVDSSGLHIEGKPFRVSPQRTVFIVAISRQQIKVTNRDYLYPQKNEDEHSYFIFLCIFFVVKLLIATIFVLASKLPKRIITISSGAFLLSAFVDWFFPINYLYRFLLVVLTEYLLIAGIGRKSISRLQAARLILLVDIIGFGIIALLYLLFVFW